LCYIAGLTPVALFWYQVLRATRQEVGLFETIRAWWVSQIVKYIPGKAMVLVVRTGMLRHPKLETTVVAASAFVETLTMMAVGSLMAFLIIVSANWANLSALLSTVNDWDDIVRLSRNRTVVTAVAALGMFVATGLPTWPPMMKLLVKMLGVGRFNPAAAEKLGSVAYRVLLGGWLLAAVGWVLQGLGLWATLQALDVHPPLADLPMNIATVAM